MRKNTSILFLLIFILGLSWSCRQKIKIIPEITPDITEEIIYDLKDKEAVGKIITHEKKLIFVTLKGEISRFDPVHKTLESLIDFNIDIEPEIFTQNNFIVLKQRNSHNYTFFNLSAMQLEKKIDKLNMERIIAVDKDILIYREKNTLFFFDYHNEKNKKELKIEKDIRIYNSEFLGDKILILSNRDFYIYDKKRNAVAAWPVKDEPASGFLLDNGFIYYGSMNRKLVKFSLKSKKASWKFNLPVILKLKPQKTLRHIIITPEDNNIYFFTKKGSMRWWTSFDAPQVLPAIVMKKNAAVFLMNREYRRMNNKLRFFNYKDQEVVSFEFKYQLESNPVYLDNYIYILCKDEEKGVKYISRIGNKYDIELQIRPEKLKPMGKSINFNIKSINLIDPEAKIEILDKSQNSVFSKEIGKGKDLFFVWIPEKAGEYKCVVEVNAENKKKLKAEEDFKVIDIDTIVKGYYFELFKKSSGVFPKEKKNVEEKEKKKDAEESEKVKEEGKKKGKTKKKAAGKKRKKNRE